MERQTLQKVRDIKLQFSQVWTTISRMGVNRPQPNLACG